VSAHGLGLRYAPLPGLHLAAETGRCSWHPGGGDRAELLPDLAHGARRVVAVHAPL